mgnify:CR=1 FL=1
MHSAEYVINQITEMKTQGIPLSEVAWKAAKLCVGWAYVFGARGENCTPSNRRSRYSDKYPTIKSKCKNFNGVGSCVGCRWYPNSKRTKFFDCRGFTYWILLNVYEWKLMGAGATSQWNNTDNWKSKGEIGTMPKDTLCCLFVKKGKKMEHTGFGLNNETIECSSGVQYFTKRNAKWTHWAIPKCIDSITPIQPSSDSNANNPTLKCGSKGNYVVILQKKLLTLGYKLPKYGSDGSFGSETEAAVKQFQADNKLKVDGIVGKNTWAALLKC